MYAAIAHELQTIMSTIKTAEQCAARVRTVLNRKKKRYLTTTGHQVLLEACAI